MQSRRSMFMEINGKRVLISGAGRGLGRTLVAAFVAAGGREVLAGTRNPEVRESLKQEFLKGVTPVQLDVTSDADINALTDFGTIDILVNNAGIEPAAARLRLFNASEFAD